MLKLPDFAPFHVPKPCRLGGRHAVLAVCLLTPSALLAGGYDEGVSGDLSGNGLAPTGITLDLGSNEIHGTTGRTAGVVDRDYFTFHVPAGLTLEAVRVLAGTTSGGVGSLSFIGLEAGPQLTLGTSPADATSLLGWDHYGPGDIGTDLLPDMAIPQNGSSGFTIPLGEGDYSVWVQELSTGSFSYNFDFVVGEVPESRNIGWIVAGALGTMITAKARSRRATV